MSSLQNNQHKRMTPDLDKNHLPLSETDPEAAKHKSAEDKLQLLATFQAMQREGKLPHNAQLHDLLEKLITNKVISSREHSTSEDGKLLLNDFRDLLRTMQKALAYKNKDELFQSLVYHLHCMESPISKEHVAQSAQTQDKNSMKEEGKRGSSALFQIVKLMLINNEFRSVLGELLDISQDVFNDVVGKVGQSLQDTGNNLQDPNHSADRSGKHFVDQTLDKALNYAENPKDREHKRNSLHDQEPHLINAAKDDPRHKGLLNTGDSVHPAAIPGSFPHTQNDGQNFQNSVLDHPMYQGANDVNRNNNNNPLNHPMYQGSRAQQGQDLNQAARQEGQKYQDKVTSHPAYQDTRNKLQGHKEDVNRTVREKVPKDKQDELIRRLQNALAQVQDHPDYQNSINTIIHLTKTWSSRLTHVATDVKNQAKENDAPEQTQYRDQAEREVKAIIEIWAQGQSIDPLLRAIQNVTEDMRHDEHLRSYYHSVFDYLDRLVKEPGYISTDRSIDDGKRLMETGRHIVKGRYGDHLDLLNAESRKYLRLMADDEIAQELNQRFTDIHRHLWMDRDGNPAFKPQLFNDMKMTLLPAFIDEIKYIPIPRIEYSDPQFDIVIENLILSGDTLLPNLVETKIDSFNSFSLKTDTESKPGHQSLFVRMNEIQADISDVVFFYKKKTGFPKLSDRGVASVTIGGKGISVAVRVQSVTDNPAKTFKVSYCKCNVNNIKIKINDSNHDMLYKTIRPLVIGQIRKQIARGIEGKIIESLNQLDQKVTKSMVNFNQQLQNKAYEALPDSEKMTQRPPTVSQARSRPGLFSTLVAIMNRNIKTKVEKRNARKRSSMMSSGSSSMSSSARSSSLATDANQKLGAHNMNQYTHEQPNLNQQGHQQPNLNTQYTHEQPNLNQNPLGQSNLNQNTLGQPNMNQNTLGQPSMNQYSHEQPGYDASMNTGRHHSIASPPHSPKKHSMQYGNDDQHFKVATDLANAQQGQQPNQFRDQL